MANFRFNLLEENNTLNVGDIIKVDNRCFHTDFAKSLTKSGHMFVITSVKDEVYKISPVTSNISSAKKFQVYFPLDQEVTPFRKKSLINLQCTGYITDDFVIQKLGKLSNRDAFNLKKREKSVSQYTQLLEKNNNYSK